MNSVVCVKWQRLNATGGSTVVVLRRIEWLIRNFCTHICQEPVSVRSKKNFYDSRHCWLLFSCGTFDISESVSPLRADNYRKKKEDQNSFSQMRNLGGGGGLQATKIIIESVSVKKDNQGFSKSMPSGLSQKKGSAPKSCWLTEVTFWQDLLLFLPRVWPHQAKFGEFMSPMGQSFI